MHTRRFYTVKLEKKIVSIFANFAKIKTSEFCTHSPYTKIDTLGKGKINNFVSNILCNLAVS